MYGAFFMLLKIIDELIEDIDKLRLKLYYVRGALEAYDDNEDKDRMNLRDCTIKKKDNGIYVIRFRRDGYDKYFSSPNLQTAKEKARKFLKSLKEEQADRLIVAVDPTGKKKKTKITLREYALFWFETVKKPYVKNITAKGYEYRINKYISGELGNMDIKGIKPMHVQSLMNKITEKGFGRTSEDMYFLFKQIFDYALANELIKTNPMQAVKRIRHIRETGQALTLQDEQELVKQCSGIQKRMYFILLLYSGIRICEIKTIHITDRFIEAENLKRKTAKKEFKKIPITPMIQPYIRELKELYLAKSTNELAREFRILTNGKYTLKDLRHTFITRSQTCGVPQEIVSLWAGHAVKAITGKVYTHFDDDFLYQEGQKVKYAYPKK